MGVVVVKILFGLTQILSRQPETMKEDFPGAHWEEFKLFSFDFSWTMPVCGVNYWTRWFSNAVLLPFLLLGLVWVSWLTEDCCSKSDEEDAVTDDTPNLDDALVSARISQMVRGSVVPAGLGPAAAQHAIGDDGAGEVMLTRTEIASMFEKLDMRLTAEQLNGIWMEMDRDGNGTVSLDELEQWLGLDKKASLWDERKASKQSDYYFAFFLCCEYIASA